MKSITGIWIDSKEARLKRIGEGEDELIKVKSNIRSNKFKGGSRSKTPWGPMLKISESKFEAKKKSEFNEFFKKVLEALPNAHVYEIYGPGMVKVHFTQFIEKIQNSLAQKIHVVEALDSITDNQFAAKIRERAALYQQR